MCFPGDRGEEPLILYRGCPSRSRPPEGGEGRPASGASRRAPRASGRRGVARPSDRRGPDASSNHFARAVPGSRGLLSCRSLDGSRVGDCWSHREARFAGGSVRTPGFSPSCHQQALGRYSRTSPSISAGALCGAVATRAAPRCHAGPRCCSSCRRGRLGCSFPRHHPGSVSYRTASFSDACPSPRGACCSTSRRTGPSRTGPGSTGPSCTGTGSTGTSRPGPGSTTPEHVGPSYPTATRATSVTVGPSYPTATGSQDCGRLASAIDRPAFKSPFEHRPPGRACIRRAIIEWRHQLRGRRFSWSQPFHGLRVTLGRHAATRAA